MGLNYSSGDGAATNGASSCAGAAMYGGADECATGACDCTISVSVAGVISGTGKNIFTANVPIPLTCNADPDPTYQTCNTCPYVGQVCGNPPPSCPPCQVCQRGIIICGNPLPQCPPSPIIVDTTGHGFHLTSAENGVKFDIRGDGHPILVAWTAPGSGNAFLALDRNLNGRIDSGKELFGNFTEQQKSPDPNGYLALAEFDRPENGGNGDGIIDKRDAVYSKLLLWIDANHDGVSQPEELHTLPELGVYSISLKYRYEKNVDQFGNEFSYRGC